MVSAAGVELDVATALIDSGQGGAKRALARAVLRLKDTPHGKRIYAPRGQAMRAGETRAP